MGFVGVEGFFVGERVGLGSVGVFVICGINVFVFDVFRLCRIFVFGVFFFGDVFEDVRYGVSFLFLFFI